jgi:hypothetical protein
MCSFLALRRDRLPHRNLLALQRRIPSFSRSAKGNPRPVKFGRRLQLFFDKQSSSTTSRSSWCSVVDGDDARSIPTREKHTVDSKGYSRIDAQCQNRERGIEMNIQYSSSLAAFVLSHSHHHEHQQQCCKLGVDLGSHRVHVARSVRQRCCIIQSHRAQQQPQEHYAPNNTQNIVSYIVVHGTPPLTSSSLPLAATAFHDENNATMAMAIAMAKERFPNDTILVQ